MCIETSSRIDLLICLSILTSCVHVLVPLHRADTCMYHAMAHASLMFLKAVFSMDAVSHPTL